MEEIIVQPFSSEWVYATFRLQLLLGHPNLQLLALRKRTPTFPPAFENHLKVEVAVDVTDMDLPSVDSIKNSLKKDLLLKAGRVLQQNSFSGKESDKKYRMLLMKAAIFQILPTYR